jgi:hypothetical protein
MSGSVSHIQRVDHQSVQQQTYWLYDGGVLRCDHALWMDSDQHELERYALQTYIWQHKNDQACQLRFAHEFLPSPEWAKKGEPMCSRPGHRFSLPFAGAALLVLAATSPTFAQQLCICDNSSGCTQTVVGSPGNDTLYGSVANDCIYSFEGDDTIYGYGGNDHIDAGPGNDLALNGGPGNDCVCGYAGDDGFNGGDGVDTLDGLEGNDWIYGAGAADTIYGFSGYDTLDGSTGNDTLFGEGDDNDLKGGPQNVGGADSCDGGFGTDRCTQCEIVNSCEIIY